jgi:hypothetical protein
MGGPGIESRWGARFSAAVRAGPGDHPASCTMGNGSFPGVKRPGRGASHPTPSRAETNERLELYLYSPLGLNGLYRAPFTSKIVRIYKKNSERRMYFILI